MRARIAISVTALFLAIGALVGAYYYMTFVRIDTAAIEHIKDAQRKPNDFNDPSGDINVSSVDDIGYVVKGDYLLDIHYGRQVISMNKKCFENKEFRNKLGEIGIKVFTHVDDKTQNILYKVTYWDEDVDQYSKVN